MQKPMTMMAAVVAVLMVASVAHAEGIFVATLSGAEEVPPVTTNTTGRAVIAFNEDDTAAEFLLQVRRGVRITQAHIHCGPRGVNAPIFVFLAGLNMQGYDVDGIFPWISNATVTDTSIIPRTTAECPIAVTNLRDLKQLILDGNAYVNVHSVANPGGEVRGQLIGR
jgi:CHRD domain